ncbi:hypothetical protein C0993_005859 [Termitomyces sp. T159_Od127]|nr:hypothetical protein C0993_005859 [Termitomyces sp. T159_Od127]
MPLHAKIIASLGARPLSPASAPATATLHALCLTSRAFHRDAAPHLYASLYLATPRQAHLACRTLAANRRLAACVRAFWFSDESQRGRLPRAFWLAIAAALAAMPGLQRLCLFDAELENGWILATAAPFRLREAKLHFAWDAHLVAFLAAQPALHTLQCFDRIDDAAPAAPHLPLPRPALPALRRFDGNLLAAAAILPLAPPLTHLQAAVEDAAHVPRFLRRLHSVRTTLRALSVLDLPDALAADAVDALAARCPGLVYLGLVPLPPVARHAVLAPLMCLPALRTVQFDLTHWVPHPDVRAQRALACEVHTFCAQIRNIVFWVGSTRVRWAWVVLQREDGKDCGQWHSHVDVQQYPPFDLMWSMA